MKRVAVMAGLTLTTAVTLVLMSGLSAASASGGSDAPTPYTVDADGITLPSGFVFEDNGHVNVTTDEGSVSMHFEAKCMTRTDAECAGKRHADAQFIGASFIPWSAFGLPEFFCVTWVQLSQFNEHFGEGGQEPVCVVDSTPSPEPEPEPEDKLFENAGETFTCEAWVFWVEKGFYEKTYDPEANVWVFASEPTITETERTEHPTTDAEKRARGCFGSVPESPKSPELAETGFDGVEWWHVIVGGVLLAVGMGAVVVADRRGDGE